MNRRILAFAVVALSLAGTATRGADKERFVLDSMEDVSDWSTGSPEETALSADGTHVKEGRLALKFANRVDHTTGEKNYPVGWPRARKSLAASGLSDFSGYDFFECWIYAETSRPALPGVPLGIGFYHSGKTKRSSGFPLVEVKKGTWTRIVVPTSEIDDAKDVQAVQFHISESNYRHGDRVDFFVDDMVLTRFVHPVIASLETDRRLLYANDVRLTATYTLMGRRGIEDVTVRLALVSPDGTGAAQSQAAAARQGEIAIPIPDPLAPGDYTATLTLHRRDGDEIDRKELPVRVIEGPFDK